MPPRFAKSFLWRSGARLRITTPLIWVSDQTQLWTETYEIRLADPLDTQRRIAQKLTDALSRGILPSEDKPPAPEAIQQPAAQT